MKTIHEILKEVKKEFNKDKTIYGELHIGLCSAVMALHYCDFFTDEEYILFSDYLERNTKRIRIFYDFEGIKVVERKFLWKPYIRVYRNNWLNKHIKLTSQESGVKN